MLCKSIHMRNINWITTAWKDQDENNIAEYYCIYVSVITNLVEFLNIYGITHIRHHISTVHMQYPSIKLSQWFKQSCQIENQISNELTHFIIHFSKISAVHNFWACNEKLSRKFLSSIINWGRRREASSFYKYIRQESVHTPI